MLNTSLPGAKVTMKVKVQTEDTPFRPITLYLTLESPDEVASLYHRMNIEGNTVQNELDVDGNPPIVLNHMKLREILADIVDEQDILLFFADYD